MFWLLFLAIVLIAVLVLLLLGRGFAVGTNLAAAEVLAAEAPDPTTLVAVAEESGLSWQEIQEITFSSEVRGYNMQEVDDLLDKLAEQLRKESDTTSEDQ